MENENNTESRTRFSHREAYKQLIGTFFSEPNILLEDEHERDRPSHRAGWDDQLSNLFGSNGWTAIETNMRSIVSGYRQKWVGSSAVDLYEACKEISHDLLFYVFLGINQDRDRELFDRAMATSSTSSKGQFAIPLRANIGGMFESTHSRGLRAQAEFNEIVSERISGNHCPFLGDVATRNDESKSGISHASLQSHISMFSSSLVIKALSSYLTFALLQQAHHPHDSLDWLLLESERLSPPIIGVLRRVLDKPWKPTPNLEIPMGWDAWLYFPLINRDRKVYGDDANVFRADRWSTKGLAEPMTLGRGGKICLGKSLVRRIGKIVLEELGRDGVRCEVEGEIERSVQDFLGWTDDEVVRGDGWPGVKQLPVQRPREAVMVRFER